MAEVARLKIDPVADQTIDPTVDREHEAVKIQNVIFRVGCGCLLACVQVF